jgi:hypothetical protein
MTLLGVLNAGTGNWAFAALATRLSQALWVPIVEEPAVLNYVLCWEGEPAQLAGRSFIPLEAIEIASDKRAVARAFQLHGVPAPETRLLTASEVPAFLRTRPGRWVLKFPTGSGALGHRFIDADTPLPRDWPQPCVIQEFISMQEPVVYRLYAVDGELFGFNARRFPRDVTPSPWVAHARGARYVHEGTPSAQALAVARRALRACALADSFGCVDLLQRPGGEWLALEVGTDGIYNHVDRDLGCEVLEREILERIAHAFWERAGLTPPWEGPWRMQAAPA